MSTQLTALLEDARNQPTPTPQTFQTLQQVAAYTRPDMDDAKQAVALGRKEGVEALLRSPKLAPDERIVMATQMLHTFAKDPLAAPRQSDILKTLLDEGANAQAQDSEGKTPLDRIVERLDRMTGAERELAKDGRPRQRSGASVRLSQLRDQIALTLPVDHPSRINVAEFEAGLGRDISSRPRQSPGMP